MMIRDLLSAMVEAKASDLYLTVDSPPLLRIEGSTHPLGQQRLSPQDVEEIAYGIMTEKQRMAFAESLEMNLALYDRAIGRFRVNIYKQRGCIGIVIREIRLVVPTIDEWNLPPILKDISLTKRGLVIIVGGTGTGKSTTLAAMIDHRNAHAPGHIVTVEDPIEFIHQHKKSIVSQREIGLDTHGYADALKNALRQAPDVIMVGEIRDLETAEIAIQASLTGHLVFSTLHTNDSAGAITRLIDMGIEPFLVSSSVVAIMAQRLVRTLCAFCKKEYTPTTPELKEIGIEPSQLYGHTTYMPVGCDKCMQTGYRGRTGIYELLLVNDEIRTLILQNVNSQVIKNKAIEGGMHTLRMDGALKVTGGITSIEEVLRVTQEDIVED